MATYEPGTVAIATVRGVEGVRLFRHREGAWISAGLVTNTSIHADRHVTDVRPLIVLDLDATYGCWAEKRDPALIVERLRETRSVAAHAIADQIEAQTRPAITEPTGLGAVVEGREGNRWVRTDESHAFPWRKVGRHEDRVANWEGVNVYTPVRVLSEGWSE